MKNIIILILCISFFSCGNKEVAKKTEVLKLVEVRKGERSSWYEDFNSYREYYRSFKINSDLFLGIGQYHSDVNTAFESAQQNGIENIKSSLSIASLTIENYGSVLDQALEVYKQGNEIQYRYILLMEVNKVSVYNLAQEEDERVKQAQLNLEIKKDSANMAINLGDKLYLENKYNEAILAYETAIRIFKEVELYQSIDFVNAKIANVEESIRKKESAIWNEAVMRDRKISILETKENPSLPDLEELLKLYTIKKDQIRINETNIRIRNKKAEILKIERITLLENEIINIVKEGYLKDNYINLLSNYENYFVGNRVDIKKVEEQIKSEIVQNTIMLLLPKEIYYSPNNNIISQIIQDKNSESTIKVELYDGIIRENDYFKFKAYRIFYVRSLDLSASKGNFGYFANFSLNGIFKDYFEKFQKTINYTNKRSKFVDYPNELGAKESVLKENLEGF